MSFTVQIVLSGLIALVPSQDQKSMYILLLDAGKDYFASDGMKMPTHWPLLFYPCKLRDGYAGACQADEAVPKALDGFYHTVKTSQRPGQGVWELSGDTITITGAIKETDLNLKALPDAPDMQQVVSTAAPIDRDSTATTPTQGILAARANLTAGYINADDLRYYCSLQQYNFKTLTGGTASAYTSKLLNRVVVKMTVTGAFIALHLTKFGATKPRADIILRPNGTDDVVVNISNMSWCPKWSSAKPDFCDDPANSQNPHHFELYYELSDKRPPSLARPVPYTTVVCSAGSDDESRPICPLPRFRP